MDPGLEERPGRVRVGVVRRDDRHRVDAVRPLPFSAGHRVEIVVDAVRREEQVLPGEPGAPGIRRECARDELPAVVEPGRDAVDGSDERAAPAPHHAQAQAPFRGLIP